MTLRFVVHAGGGSLGHLNYCCGDTPRDGTVLQSNAGRSNYVSTILCVSITVVTNGIKSHSTSTDSFTEVYVQADTFTHKGIEAVRTAAVNGKCNAVSAKFIMMHWWIHCGTELMD